MWRNCVAKLISIPNPDLLAMWLRDFSARHIQPVPWIDVWLRSAIFVRPIFFILFYKCFLFYFLFIHLKWSILPINAAANTETSKLRPALGEGLEGHATVHTLVGEEPPHRPDEERRGRRMAREIWIFFQQLLEGTILKTGIKLKCFEGFDSGQKSVVTV